MSTNLPRCQQCIGHPGWAHADESRRREPDDLCPACKGSGVEQTEKFDIVLAIMEYEQGELSALQTLELFGHLIRTNTVWDLQGHYGRTAMALLEEGLIDAETGNITDLAVERLAALPEED
jgi:hypothetical protein